jgi:Ribonuclease G/E
VNGLYVFSPALVGWVVDGVVEEVFRDSGGVGEIRLGRVVNVERGVSAAFLDIGIGANGFLHVSDWPESRRGDPIAKHLPMGTVAVVQIKRAAVGAKAVALTGQISIPGRTIVLLPYRSTGGVSRRLDRGARERQQSLEKRAGCGLILRTAAREADLAEMEREVDLLRGEWARIEAQAQSRPKPGLLRSVTNVESRARRELGVAEDVPVHRDVAPPEILHQIQELGARDLPLPSGGHIVIEQTEALLAIDVNSGKTREEGEFEPTARLANLEAADLIARQLRLRDAGGVVVVDFIDMRDEGHIAEVDLAFRTALDRDRARMDCAGLREFGLFTLTRQRRG